MNFFLKFAGIAVRTALLSACGVGIWQSWNAERADVLFQEGSEASVRAAIRIVPDAWPYYLRLAQFDRSDARVLLTRAIALSRYDAQADIELALQYEDEGNDAEAERLLLAAFDVDRTYIPRWSLANFYLRRNNLPAFWEWSHKAASLPSDDITPLFELCWHVSNNSQEIADKVLTENPETIRQFLQFLLRKDEMAESALIAPQLIRVGNAESDSPLLLRTVNQLLAANDASAAVSLWRRLIQEHWITADLSLPNNAHFARTPLPVSFDWNLKEDSGYHTWLGPSGLETEFSGEEPEDCTIAEQTLAVLSGTYELTYIYSTAEIPVGSGLRWQVLDAKSQEILGESTDLSSSTVTALTIRVVIPENAPVVRLRLAYKRRQGTIRIAGTLIMQSIVLRPVSPESSSSL